MRFQTTYEELKQARLLQKNTSEVAGFQTTYEELKPGYIAGGQITDDTLPDYL